MRWGALVVAIAVGLPACGSGSPAGTRSGRIAVVAAEDVWGSIASQLGGDRVTVRSLIDNPNTDPHDYEPTAADGRAVATAKLVIVNGIGYDPWAEKLIAANPSSGRAVVSVGVVVGLKPGDNPHQWYSPDTVAKVIDAVAVAYKKVDPAHAANYDRQRIDFENTALSAYRAAIHDISTRYAGTPMGASESIFAPLAPTLGLDLVTPPSYMDAISEGNEPTAADKATVDQQIATKAIKVFVYNSQNATPDVRRLVASAKANGIAVTTVTETIVPKGASFQDWQTRQMLALAHALAAATGK